MLTLSFLFEENGDLKDAFRLYPRPIEANYPDPTLGELRVRIWQEANLDRIPDWEKVQHYLDTHQQS